MVRHVTILENGTGSPFEVRSESSSGVHSLMAELSPGATYKLVLGYSDTYLQHWVMVGDAPVVSFSSDELVDNERIKIITVGAVYEREVTPRHSSPKLHANIFMARNQRSQSVGAESGSRTTSDVGKPPTGFKRLLSAVVSPFIKRSPESNVRSVNSEPILELSKTPDSTVRSVNSEPILDSTLPTL